MNISLDPVVQLRGPAPLHLATDVEGNGAIYISDVNGPPIVGIRRKDTMSGSEVSLSLALCGPILNDFQYQMRLAPGLDIVMVASIIVVLEEVRQLSTAKLINKVMGLAG